MKYKNVYGNKNVQLMTYYLPKGEYNKLGFLTCGLYTQRCLQSIYLVKFV